MNELREKYVNMFTDIKKGQGFVKLNEQYALTCTDLTGRDSFDPKAKFTLHKDKDVMDIEDVKMLIELFEEASEFVHLSYAVTFEQASEKVSKVYAVVRIGKIKPEEDQELLPLGGEDKPEENEYKEFDLSQCEEEKKVIEKDIKVYEEEKAKAKNTDPHYQALVDELNRLTAKLERLNQRVAEINKD